MSHHLHILCALLDGELDEAAVERCRDEYLASLDADDGLVVLQIPYEEIVSAATARPPVARCDRCGARQSAKRHRCSRCGLRYT